MPFSGLSAWCHFLVCFLRAISLLNRHVPLMLPRNYRVLVLTHRVVYAIKIVGLETHYLCCCLHILKVHFIVAFQGLLLHV